MKKIIVLLVVLSVLSFMQIKEWIVESGPLQNVTNVVIPKGASSRMVANELEEAKVINRAWLFRILARINGLDKHLKAGEYQFMPQISLLEAMEKISRGEVYFRKITIPEGLTSGQIMYIISNYPDLSGEVEIDVKEGEILPETYSFELGATRNSILLQAKSAMKKVQEEAWAARDANLPLKNINEMMTLASIIEKETALAEERPLVASVFVNRLRKRMRLQTDPTVIYALTEGETTFGRSLKRSDLGIDSPYNTYKNYGLPPGPICNPGKDAIYAAVQPESSNFLYFVADGNGGHSFAKNLNDHNQNVKDWIKSRNN